MLRPLRLLSFTHAGWLFFFSLTTLGAIGCGGGPNNTSGASGSQGTASTADFTISASPSSLVIGTGQSLTVTILIQSLNHFSSSVALSAVNIPAGVTVSPASISMNPANPQQVTIAADASASPGSGTLSFQATSQNLSHSTQLSIQIEQSVTSAYPPVRTRYLRNNSFYDPNTLEFSPPHFTVYDAAHKQFFVSNPYLNEIDVYDAASELQTASISVPMAWGIDVSPYNNSLYAGTLLGDVYQIDTGTLKLIQRFPSASIGPAGFIATTALVLSDGRLALQGGARPLLGVDGFGSPAVWDPVANTLDTGPDGDGACAENGSFALSGDRKLILATTVDTVGGGNSVCAYDPVAKVATYGDFPEPNFAREIIPTPDGSRAFITTNTAGVGVFDTHTVQMVGQIQGSGSDLPSAAISGVVSPNGKTLYLISQTTGNVAAYDTTSYALTGWLPSMFVSDAQTYPAIGAMDETGLIAGPIGHGTAFLDATNLVPAPFGQLHTGSASPSVGPLSGGTTLIDLASTAPGNSAQLTQIYVGNAPGSNGSINQDSAQVTTPPSLYRGPVNITLQTSDGGEVTLPENFSYGPTILDVVPNAATAEGGQTGVIIGYGFAGNSTGMSLTVNGQSAKIIKVDDTFDILGPTVYPFPVYAITYIIPPGQAGSVADVTVTTPDGAATAKGTLTYSAPTQSFPVNSLLQAGIYDSYRNLYFFTSQNQIQVLSPSAGGWLPPMTLPGITNSSSLLAISESPDGSKLAVSDSGSDAIYVLDPDNPATAIRYSTTSAGSPLGLAVSDAGSVFFAAGAGFHQLDTPSGSIQDIDIGGPWPMPASERVLLSPDGSRVYSNAGFAFWIDTSTLQMHQPTSAVAIRSGAFPELAISHDGSTLDIEGYLTDASMNAETVAAYQDWETWFPQSVAGQKLSPDGSLLFQPLTDAIDIIARNTGRLLYRLQIPATTASVYDALVVGNAGTQLAVITTTGVCLVDISNLAIPSGDTQLFPNSQSSPAGPSRTPSFPGPAADSSLSRLLMARPHLVPYQGRPWIEGSGRSPQNNRRN